MNGVQMDDTYSDGNSMIAASNVSNDCVMLLILGPGPRRTERNPLTPLLFLLKQNASRARDF